MRRPIIALDGPGGSGKSTVGRLLAARLGLRYIDSGAMYRAVALLALRHGVDLDDEAAMARLAAGAEIDFTPGPDGQRVLLGGEDVSQAIRAAPLAQAASRVSALSAVRREMVRRQQALGRDGGVVMDGRDIGTVVFPQADLKVYLDAPLAERARRRLAEEAARGGAAVGLDETLSQMAERDRRDMNRVDSPLCRAADAAYLDTGGLTVDEVVDRLIGLAGGG